MSISFWRQSLNRWRCCFFLSLFFFFRILEHADLMFYSTKFYVQLVQSNNSNNKKRNTAINSNVNYRREMMLVQINTDYCLLQFDALKFFLEVRLHGGSLPNFNFFNVNPQIFQRNPKVHISNCLETNFNDIFNISLRIIRRRNYS